MEACNFRIVNRLFQIYYLHLKHLNSSFWLNSNQFSRSSRLHIRISKFCHHNRSNKISTAFFLSWVNLNNKLRTNCKKSNLNRLHHRFSKNNPIQILWKKLSVTFKLSFKISNLLGNLIRLSRNWYKEPMLEVASTLPRAAKSLIQTQVRALFRRKVSKD
jgi:hypothetical protein